MVSPLYHQRVYVDTSALIYAIEAPHLYPRLQTHFLDLFVHGQLTIVTSWITFAEVLAKPLQHGDALAEAGYREFFLPSPHFEILAVDQRVSDQAASLRALHGIKLPDALHIATGMIAACPLFLTGDAKWAQTGLRIIDVASL